MESESDAGRNVRSHPPPATAGLRPAYSPVDMSGALLKSLQEGRGEESLRVLYRTYSGINAVDLRTGQPAWSKPVVLQQSLDSVLADGELRGQLIARGRRRAKNTFDWPVVANQTVELFRSAMLHRRRAQPTLEEARA